MSGWHWVLNVDFISNKLDFSPRWSTPIFFWRFQWSFHASQAMTSRGPQWIRGSCQGFYHYADTTCDYACLLTEGFYWSLTSLLGGQDACECHARKDHYRCCSISDQWRPCTSHEMRRGRNDLGGSCLRIKYPLCWNSHRSQPLKISTLPGYSPGKNPAPALPKRHEAVPECNAWYPQCCWFISTVLPSLLVNIHHISKHPICSNARWYPS